MKLEFSRWIFGKYWDIKFNKYPSTGVRVVTCGRTDRQRGTHMKKVVVSFRRFAATRKTDLLMNPVLRSVTFWRNVRWSVMCTPLHNVEGIDATVVFVCVLNLRNCYTDVTPFWPVDRCGQYAKTRQSVAKYAHLLLCTVRIQTEGSTAKYVGYWNIKTFLLRTEYRPRNLDCFYAWKCVYTVEACLWWYKK